MKCNSCQGRPWNAVGSVKGPDRMARTRARIKDALTVDVKMDSPIHRRFSPSVGILLCLIELGYA